MYVRCAGARTYKHMIRRLFLSSVTFTRVDRPQSQRYPHCEVLACVVVQGNPHAYEIL